MEQRVKRTMELGDNLTGLIFIIIVVGILFYTGYIEYGNDCEPCDPVHTVFVECQWKNNYTTPVGIGEIYSCPEWDQRKEDLTEIKGKYFAVQH